MRAEAVVDPIAELQVLGGVGPVDVDLVGIGSPTIGVVVGGADAAVEDVAGRDGSVAALDRLRGDATHELVGPVVAEQLVHGVRPE